MGTREIKDKIYEELSLVAGAIANPKRMEIIDMLAQGSFPVETIAKQTAMSIANTSKHLQVLKNARIVTTAKKGNYVYYKLIDENVLKVWESLRDLGIEQNSEVLKLLHDYKSGDSTVIPTNGDNLMAKIEKGETILLDVSSVENYNRSHLHNAISMPLEQLKERISELSKDVEIIAYCRGKLCVLSDEAVEFLKQNGYNAKKLIRDPEWFYAV
ncbi:MAG TPA: ArsR family transcriptional regulator [Porphyromonadaceae bacterium]|nr:ArsR family transcriptional regulator [Porphyromonadaceae bacterium]